MGEGNVAVGHRSLTEGVANLARARPFVLSGRP
jgi:hypothetical protein